MGSNIIKPPGVGPYCFKVQGQIYHFASPLHPKNGHVRQFAQLYVLDANQALYQRMAIIANTSCLSHTMKIFADMIEEYNPFAKSYKMLHDVELEELRKAQISG